MPYDFGGAERFAVDLAAEITKSGWDSLVVSGSKKLLNYAESQAVKFRPGWWWQKQNWSGTSLVFFLAYLVWQLILTLWYLQLILRHKADVIHPQSKDDFIAATIAGKLLQRRVIWTDHADLKYVYKNHAVWYRNPVGKLVYLASKFADKITLVSESERKLISHSLGRSLPPKYVVVHNGSKATLLDTIKPVARSREDFVFCVTSRLVRAKGIGELLEAFEKLYDSYANARLWLVGDGPDEQIFKTRAASTDGVTFFGHSDTPLDYVAACDVFVHPSHHEGFSLSLIEAAMLGKPIVACNVGGNPEIIKDGATGLLVPAQNPEALAEAMERLINDLELAKSLGANAKQVFNDSFRFETIVEETILPLYEKS